MVFFWTDKFDPLSTDLDLDVLDQMVSDLWYPCET
jgi:hypothetical protein